jgi:hypothetical protein
VDNQCHMCGKEFNSPIPPGAVGYAEDSEGWRYCYACCAFLDKEAMRRDGHIALYLSKEQLSNWPGTLKIVPKRIKRSLASAFGRPITRYDVWFEFEGTQWHGVNQGDNEICRCRRLAAR